MCEEAPGRRLMPHVSVDSDETLILGHGDPRNREQLAALLPDMVEGFNERMSALMQSPGEIPIPEGKL